MTNFTKIAVGVDFSPSAQAALDVARNSFPGAQLKLIHVVDARAGSVPDLSTGGLAPVMPSAEVLTQLSAGDERQLDRLARDLLDRFAQHPDLGTLLLVGRRDMRQPASARAC